MERTFNKISVLSRLAIAVFNNPKQQIPQPFQSGEDSSYTTEISAHCQAVAHVRTVQAEYQIRGWMR